MQPQNFHAVLQRAGDGVEDVRRGHEEHLREVVLDIEVVVLEVGVLFGVEHLEQGRGGIAAEVRGHLVHLVQHKDGVLGAGLLHGLNDLAGQRADVGAPVAADLGFVAHAAQRHAHKLAAGGLGDRHAERGLAHARRSDEAEDGALRILHELTHGEELEDALLDLLQAIVIGVENLLRGIDRARLFRLLLPRHGEQPVQVVAGDGRLGGHRRHRFELLQLLHRLVHHVLGHAGGFDLLLQIVELALLAAAQLLLDGLDLLVEVVLLLCALHLPLHPALDGAVHVELFDLHVQQVGDARQPLGGIKEIQQLLLFFDRQLQIGGDGVGQFARLVHTHGGHDGFVVQALLELDVLLKQAGDLLHQLLGLRAGRGDTRNADGGDKEAVGIIDFGGFGALQSLNQYFNVSVRHLHALDDVANSADGIDVVGLGLVDRGVVLRREEDATVAVERLFERAHARFAADDERRHHVGEDHHLADGHHGQLADLAALPLLLGLPGLFRVLIGCHFCPSAHDCR